MATVPLTLVYEVLPSALPDEATTVLYYRVPKASKFAKSIRKAFGITDSPSTPGEAVVPWRWLKLTTAAACRLDLAAVGAVVPVGRYTRVVNRPKFSSPAAQAIVRGET